MKTTSIIIFSALLAAAALFVAGYAIAPHTYGNTSATEIINTTGGGFTNSTTTVNTTSTQIYASINVLSYLVNTSGATLTCSLDPRGSTAASSSVAANRGVVIGPYAGTGSPSEVSFGQCIPGSPRCYATTGAVDCLASVATTVTKIVQ